MQSLPMIMVTSVSESARWYRTLLGAENDHGGEEFDRIVAGGEPLLMLHHWTTGEHGLRPPIPGGRLGDGVVVWFSVDDLDAAFARATALDAEVVAAPWDNPRAGWREFTVRDPDGYAIALFKFP